MPTEPKAEMRPWNPGPLETTKHALQDMMGGIGSFASEHNIPFLKALDDPQYTRGVAENLTSLSEIIPGISDVQDARVAHDLIANQDQPLAGGVMVAGALLPFVPGSALLKFARKAGVDIDLVNNRYNKLVDRLSDIETDEYHAQSFLKSGPADRKEGERRLMKATGDRQQTQSQMRKMEEVAEQIQQHMDVELNTGGAVHAPLMPLKYRA